MFKYDEDVLKTLAENREMNCREISNSIERQGKQSYGEYKQELAFYETCKENPEMVQEILTIAEGGAGIE